MTLLVRVPDTYLTERRYVFDLVLTEWFGLEYELIADESSGVAISLRGDESRSELRLPDVLFATPRQKWLTERSTPERPLARLLVPARRPEVDDAGSRPTAAPAADVVLPAVFGTPAADNLAWRRTPTGASISIDIFGSSFYLLTRAEETLGGPVDQYQRFPASASLAAAEGFLQRPIVDEYVELLWGAMHALWPRLTRRSARFRLSLTHDVDRAWSVLGRRPVAVARSFAGDLLRRHDLGLTLRRAQALAESRVGRVDHDPENTFDFLMDTSERLGMRDTFYFLAATKAPAQGRGATRGVPAVRYRLADPPIAALLGRIHSRGHEVGLHGSYDSYLSVDRIRSEFQALVGGCRAVGFDQPAWGVRQHFLRFRIPDTWRNLEAAGLDHDLTLGFADEVGFRAGTCREYPVFDLLERRVLRLRERPLLVMDATLFDYLGLTLEEAASRTRSIVSMCRRHRGDAVVLYHNDWLMEARRRRHYRELVEELARPGD